MAIGDTPLPTPCPVSELIGERMLLTVVIALGSVHADLGRGFADRRLFRGQAVLDRRLCRVIPRLYRCGCPGFSGRVDCHVPGFQMDRLCGGRIIFARVCASTLESGKVFDLMKRLWVPAVIVGLSGVAGTIRTTRANLLDELHRPYVVTARSKGFRKAASS